MYALRLSVSIWIWAAARALGLEYDAEEARRFASLSSAAYCDELDVVRNWTCIACKDSKTLLEPGVKIIDGGESDAVRVIVGKLQEEAGCVVAFRGTDNLHNWLRNFEAWEHVPRAYPDCDGCEVHSGFYTMWKNVQDDVLEALRNFSCKEGTDGSPKVHIAGHSQGAALAVLAMFSLDDAGFHIGKSYTIEGPRIGNQQFVDRFSQRFLQKLPFFRVTHNQDPVPHLPPQWMTYRHVPHEAFYDAQGNYTVCMDAENITCIDQFSDVPGQLLLHLGDHCGSPLVPNGDICNPVGCAAKTSSIIV